MLFLLTYISYGENLDSFLVPINLSICIALITSSSARTSLHQANVSLLRWNTSLHLTNVGLFRWDTSLHWFNEAFFPTYSGLHSPEEDDLRITFCLHSTCEDNFRTDSNLNQLKTNDFPLGIGLIRPTIRLHSTDWLNYCFNKVIRKQYYSFFKTNSHENNSFIPFNRYDPLC
jgi:hypothetical protein